MKLDDKICGVDFGMMKPQDSDQDSDIDFIINNINSIKGKCGVNFGMTKPQDSDIDFIINNTKSIKDKICIKDKIFFIGPKLSAESLEKIKKAEIDYYVIPCTHRNQLNFNMPLLGFYDFKNKIKEGSLLKYIDESSPDAKPVTYLENNEERFASITSLETETKTPSEIKAPLEGEKYKEIGVKKFKKITDLPQYVNGIETSVKNTSSPNNNSKKTVLPTSNLNNLKGFKEIDKNSTTNKDVALLKSTLDIGSNKIGSKGSTKFYENGDKVAILLSKNDFCEAILKLQALENQGKIKLNLTEIQRERFDKWKNENPHKASAVSSQLSELQESKITKL